MDKELTTTAVTVEEAVAARPDYENEIIAIVRGTDSPKAAQSKLEDYHGNDIAQAMESLTLSERKKLCRICTAAMLAEAFEHLEIEDATAYLNEMDVKKASAVTEELDADTAALHQTIKHDSLRGHIVCDRQEWNSPLVRSFGVRDVPSAILVDTAGTVIARDLNEEALGKELEHLGIKNKD